MSAATAANQVLGVIRRQLANLVARAVVQLVDDTRKLQVVQIGVLEEELRADCERLQPYGLTSVPLPGAEAAVLFVGGLRDHALVLAVDDRRYRLRNLQSGQVALYTHTGTYFLLKPGAAHESNASIDLVSDAVLKVDGNQVVGPRLGSIAPPSGGGTVDTGARTAIATIIERLQTHGLIE